MKTTSALVVQKMRAACAGNIRECKEEAAQKSAQVENSFPVFTTLTSRVQVMELPNL